MKITRQIGKEDSGKTLRQLFAQMKLSTNTIKKFKYDGNIDVNGQTRNVNYVLQNGDTLTLVANERVLHPQSAEIEAKILYVDDFLYIADKPYGIATHPDRKYKTDTLANRLSKSFGEDFSLRIVTRLDKTTSGLVLGAFDGITAERLNSMQTTHQIDKTYVALVQGIVNDDSGTINLPLDRLDTENKTIVCTSGKPSLTTFTVIQRDKTNNRTLVELYPKTGRTHQLRAHMAAIGHPIVGDTLYGANAFERVCLHCYKLQFAHPFCDKTVTVTSEIDV